MIELKGSPKNEEVYIKMKTSNRITSFAIRRAWFAVGKDVLTTARKEIRKKPRHGKVYVRRTASGRKRVHVASRPYESHANFSGDLGNSMQWKVSGPDLRFGYGIAKANAPDYASDMENGTPGGKIKPRPTLRNSINDNKRNAEQHLVSSVNEGFE